MDNILSWFSTSNKKQKTEEAVKIPSLEPRQETCIVKTQRENVERNVQVNVKDFLENNSDFVTVAEFQAGNTIGLPSSWQFWIKRYSDQDDKTVLGLYLRCLSRDQYKDVSLNACFVTTLLHPQDQKKNIIYDGTPQNFSTVDSWGMRKFVQGNAMNEYINKNGEVSFHLRFTLQNSKQEADPLKKMEDESIETWKHGLLSEFLGDNHKDILVKSTKSEKEPLWANKVMLAGRSKYFRDIIGDIKAGRANDKVGFRDDHPMVSVDISHDALLHLMCHIYHGYLNENLIDPEKCSVELARELVAAAAEHELLHLEQYLLQFHPGLEEKENPGQLREDEGEAGEQKESETDEQIDAEVGQQKEAETGEQKDAETEPGQQMQIDAGEQGVQNE